MRVVSLVPSWTETLLEAGANVVGRTRFCVHPQQGVKDIPTIGGTKDWNWPAIQALKPDLIVLDQEENPKWMSEQTEIPLLITHITHARDVSGALAQMSMRLRNGELAKMALRWEAIAQWRGASRWVWTETIPGLIEWGRRPEKSVHHVVYVIWRNPWMTVSRSTFIGSMLTICGLGDYLRDFREKYPPFNMHDFVASETLFLFASEPYPFLRKKEVLNPLAAPFAIVDGERFSWFGLRSLLFLEELRARDLRPSP